MTDKGPLVCLLISLLIFFSVIPNAHAGSSPFNCNCPDEDRDLHLTTPLQSGEDVRELQIILSQLGHYQGLLDGIYNAKLAQAVKEFQICVGLPANGKFGKEERQSLTIHFAHGGMAPPQEKLVQGEWRIEINLEKKMLTLYLDGQVYKEYPCAIGKEATKTPVGEWRIIQKGTHWGGGFGTRWLGLNVPWGIYGIHGTNNPSSIGAAASAGCIRMQNKDVEELYPLIDIGTRVSVIGPFPKIPITAPLQIGQNNKAVQGLQLALREAGFNPGSTDGYFGPDTEAAVRKLQTFFGLSSHGRADNNVLVLLDLR